MPDPSPGDPYGIIALNTELERTFLQWECLVGVVLPLASIPVASAHGVPTLLAGLVSGSLAIALIVVGITKNIRWGWHVGGICAMLTFWPCIVYVAWAFFAGLFALSLLIAWLSIRRDRWARRS